MAVIPPKNALPGKQSQAYELLELTAIFGELPTKAISRLSGGESYKEKIITALKQQGLIKSYYADGLRGLRPTTTAKRLLLADNPERFSFFLDGNSDTNHVRSDPRRRERLHRIAEATITMKNAGVVVFRDERPSVFGANFREGEHIRSPAFYNSREMKETGFMYAKYKESRSVGILLTEQNAFLTYSLGDSLMKWDSRSEMRAKTFVETVLCLQRLPTQYSPENIKALIFGNTQALAYEILSSDKKNFHYLDENFDNLHYLTNDRKGELLLKLLCNREMREELDDILTDGLYYADTGALIENDAMTEDGRPVLLAYTLDLARIRRFALGLKLHEKQGVLICFDYQAEVLKRYCGERADIQTLDYEKVERRFFT